MGRKNRRKKKYYRKKTYRKKNYKKKYCTGRTAEAQSRREAPGRTGREGVNPRRMEIWTADLPFLPPSHVQGGARPVVIVSNDAANMHVGTVTVIPLTTKMKKMGLPAHAMVEGTGMASQALAEQITTIDKWRLGRLIGVCGNAEELENAIKTQLGLLPEKEGASAAGKVEGSENEQNHYL